MTRDNLKENAVGHKIANLLVETSRTGDECHYGRCRCNHGRPRAQLRSGYNDVLWPRNKTK